jgi:hypothetical protein
MMRHSATAIIAGSLGAKSRSAAAVTRRCSSHARSSLTAHLPQREVAQCAPRAQADDAHE